MVKMPASPEPLVAFALTQKGAKREVVEVMLACPACFAGELSPLLTT